MYHNQDENDWIILLKDNMLFYFLDRSEKPKRRIFLLNKIYVKMMFYKICTLDLTRNTWNQDIDMYIQLRFITSLFGILTVIGYVVFYQKHKLMKRTQTIC